MISPVGQLFVIYVLYTLVTCQHINPIKATVHFGFLPLIQLNVSTLTDAETGEAKSVSGRSQYSGAQQKESNSVQNESQSHMQ